jgi:hypothetical protein
MDGQIQFIRWLLGVLEAIPDQDRPADLRDWMHYVTDSPELRVRFTDGAIYTLRAEQESMSYDWQKLEDKIGSYERTHRRDPESMIAIYAEYATRAAAAGLDYQAEAARAKADDLRLRDQIAAEAARIGIPAESWRAVRAEARRDPLAAVAVALAGRLLSLAPPAPEDQATAAETGTGLAWRRNAVRYLALAGGAPPDILARIAQATEEELSAIMSDIPSLAPRQAPDPTIPPGRAEAFKAEEVRRLEAALAEQRMVEEAAEIDRQESRRVEAAGRDDPDGDCVDPLTDQLYRDGVPINPEIWAAHGLPFPAEAAAPDKDPEPDPLEDRRAQATFTRQEAIEIIAALTAGGFKAPAYDKIGKYRTMIDIARALAPKNQDRQRAAVRAMLARVYPAAPEEATN